MRRIVVASTRRAAGKTSVIVGIARNLDGGVGYMKPLGDRLLYRKKRLWDYDAALMTAMFGIGEAPEDISVGMDHSKMRYMFDEAGIGERLREMAERVGAGHETVFVEGSRGLTHGASVRLDPLSVARALDAELLLVASGTPDTVVDDLAFIQRNVDLSGVRFTGVVVNKVTDMDDFRDVHLGVIEATGVRVLGVLPHREELTRFRVRLLEDALFAKLLAGEAGMDRLVEHIFVGAMSGQAALRDPQFQQASKLIITSGDRTDMIQAALDSDTAALVLTNNVPPSAKLVSKAEDRGIPLLLVPQDTFRAAKEIDDLEPLLTAGDEERADLLGQLVRGHVDVGALSGVQGP